ncbi:MAG: FHA domain-containing protein [Planctomycetota bacterium]
MSEQFDYDPPTHTRRVARPRGPRGPLPTPQVLPAPRGEAKAWIHCPPLPPVALGAQRPQVRIGRSDADITLPHKEVSRRHATIRLDGGAILVEDLGSSNGTYLNHVLLRAPATLQPGDRVGIGPYELRISDRQPLSESNVGEEMDATAVVSSLAGDLAEVSMSELFQDLEFNARSGVLEARHRRSYARLEVEGGVPCAASYEGLSGHEAMLAMLAMRSGHFVFSGSAPKERARLPQRLTAVLLDFARAQDEGGAPAR